MAGQRIAGVELGGTKAIAILYQDQDIVEQTQLPTGDDAPATLAALAQQLAQWNSASPLDALGIASFGPVALNPADPAYGHILTTPKKGWSGAAVLPILAASLTCPVSIDTDVNAAAFAEWRWGAAQGATSVVYLTIGTGLGGGMLVNGQPVHGRLHPEIGHIRLRRAPGDDFAGHCKFHGDCAEGLLCGPALKARFEADPATVPAEDPRWLPVMADLAELLATLIHCAAPQHILIGGGVGMGAPHLLPGAIARLPALLAGYYPDLDMAALSRLITPPGLGDRAGPLGAIAVGLSALEH